MVELQRRWFIMLLVSAAVAWSLVFVSLAASLAAEPLPRSVLIIDQSGPGLPFYAGISSGIRAAVISGSASQVSIYHEQLDVTRFRGPVYEHSLNAHFRVKYRDKRVGVIIAVGSAALEYVLRSRVELWPEVPVVFTFVDKPAIAQLELPPDVTGTTLQSHPRDMVAVARTLVPDIKRIALFIMLLGGVAVAWSLASVALAGSLAAAPLPRSVLIIDQYGPGLPFSAGISSGIRAAVISGSATQVSVYHEQLDLARFRGPVYEHSLNAHFRVKYRDKQVGVIIAVGPAALEYVLRSRAELWPEVPVVFTFVDKPTITQLKLPPDVTGNTLQSHPRDMVTVARTLVPDIKGIALVGDPPENQTYYRDLKKEVPIVAADLEFIDLTGLTMTELRKRVAMLPDQTAILHTSIYSDGEGNSLIPADAVALVAETANRPIVVDLDTHFGRGTVGGLITTSSSLGEAAGKIALRILNGEIASNIPIKESELARPIFDWRQLKRFGISEANLPPGSEVRFRELTAWEQYRWQIMLIAAALVIQTTLIIWLYYEHRRRRNAEADSRSALAKFADMN